MQLLQRYAKGDFLAEHSSDPSARRLPDALATDIQRILHEVISTTVGQIVEQLNAAGHNLRHYEDPVPGSIALRDDIGEGADYTCDLRLAVDTAISVGFRDTVNSVDI